MTYRYKTSPTLHPVFRTTHYIGSGWEISLEPLAGAVRSGRVALASLDKSAGAEDMTVPAPASSLISSILGIMRLGLN